MKFEAQLVRLPGGFTMSCENVNFGGEDDPHGMNGKKAPVSRSIVMLKEVLSGGEGYFQRVPVNSPTRTQYGIVAQEVIWTKYKYRILVPIILLIVE